MSLMKLSLRVLLLLITLFSSGMALESASVHEDISALSNLNINPTIHLSDSVKSVATMMQSVDKLPSCNYIASRALINSCSQLDQSSTTGHGEGLDIILDQAKAIYGARLAVCELLEANSPVPSTCSAFKPNPRNTRKQGFRGFFSSHGPSTPVALYEIYDEETAKHLKTCSASLASKPQWWTSYSNARQNAVAMCHAMRAEVEKDDIIEFTKMMMDVANQATADMSAISKQSPAVLQDFQAMRGGMEGFQTALNDGLEDIQQAIAEHWARLRNEVQTVAKDVSEVGVNINSVLQDAQQASANLNIHRGLSEESVRAMQQMMDLLNGAKETSTELLALQVGVQQHSNVALDLVFHMASSIQALDRSVGKVHHSFDRIDNSLNSTLEVVEAIGRDAANLPTLSVLLGGFSCSFRDVMSWLADYFAVFVFVWALTFVCLRGCGMIGKTNSCILGFATGTAIAVASSHVPWGPIFSSIETETLSHLIVAGASILFTTVIGVCFGKYLLEHRFRAMQPAGILNDFEALGLHEENANVLYVDTKQGAPPEYQAHDVEAQLSTELDLAANDIKHAQEQEQPH